MSRSRWNLILSIGLSLAFPACADQPSPTAPDAQPALDVSTTEVVTTTGTRAPRSHDFSTVLEGIPAFAHSMPSGHLLTYAYGRVNGFSSNASVYLEFDRIGAGPFQGTFSALRVNGGGSMKLHGFNEVMYGTVVGTAYDVGDGMLYNCAVTITGGTGRLDGATGSIVISVYVHGYPDPATASLILDANHTYDGEYIIP